MADRRKNKKRKSNAGWLVLIIGLAILFFIFAAKYPDIKATLEKTNFLDLVKQRVTTTSSTTVLPAVLVPSSSTTNAPSQPGVAPSSTAQPPTTTAAPISPVSGAQDQPQAQHTVDPSKVRQASLFFVKIEEDGLITRKEVKRVVPISDTPLGDAMGALLAGPSEGEIRAGLISLIPRGTKLLGITMRGSTAIIDLSDAFMYNRYGVEGFSAQLKQIVYTATSFPSVQDVQILIEGKTRDYLGGEGVYIGKPLSRNSF